MVAERWGWDAGFMLHQFGWKAALACVANAIGATFLYHAYLAQRSTISAALARIETPWPIVLVHVVFITAVVGANHHPLVFISIFLPWTVLRRLMRVKSGDRSAEFSFVPCPSFFRGSVTPPSTVCA
jgi:hypothetical protein